MPWAPWGPCPDYGGSQRRRSMDLCAWAAGMAAALAVRVWALSIRFQALSTRFQEKPLNRHPGIPRLRRRRAAGVSPRDWGPPPYGGRCSPPVQRVRAPQGLPLDLLPPALMHSRPQGRQPPGIPTTVCEILPRSYKHGKGSDSRQSTRYCVSCTPH